MNTPCLLADVDPSWLLLAGIAVLTSVMVRLTYRRGRHRQASKALTNAPPPSMASVRHAATSKDLLRRLEEKEVEFEERSREALARLDNKIAVLQCLLAEAESTITRLQEFERRGQSRVGTVRQE